MIHLYIKQIINVCVYVCLYTHTYMLYLCVFKYDIYMKQIIHVLYIYMLTQLEFVLQMLEI